MASVVQLNRTPQPVEVGSPCGFTQALKKLCRIVSTFFQKMFGCYRDPDLARQQELKVENARIRTQQKAVNVELEFKVAMEGKIKASDPEDLMPKITNANCLATVSLPKSLFSAFPPEVKKRFVKPPEIGIALVEDQAEGNQLVREMDFARIGNRNSTIGLMGARGIESCLDQPIPIDKLAMINCEQQPKRRFVLSKSGEAAHFYTICKNSKQKIALLTILIQGESPLRECFAPNKRVKELRSLPDDNEIFQRIKAHLTLPV